MENKKKHIVDYLKNYGTNRKKYTNKVFIKTSFTHAHKISAKSVHNQTFFSKLGWPPYLTPAQVSSLQTVIPRVG